MVLACVVGASAVVPAVAFAGGSEGVTVFAGPNLQAPPPGAPKNADALAFFPKLVTVHVGDPVTWQFRGFHTITFAGGKKQYPFIAPLASKQPALNDAAGQPFWWAGKLPQLGVSPLALLPQGGASVSSAAQIHSSGMVRLFAATQNKPPAPFVLTFTKPGVYHYQCAIHPSMRGVVRVVPASTPVPSIAAVNLQAQKQLQQDVVSIHALAMSKPTQAATVFVGAGQAASGAEIAQFFPNVLHVAVGSTVTFRNNDQTDVHTVTFGPAAVRSRIEKDLVAPHGKLVLFDPLGALASEPPAGAPVDYDGSNHGNGYLNAGLLFPKGSPAAAGPQSFQITFTKAGTYHYECVIHQNMDGTVVVG